MSTPLENYVTISAHEKLVYALHWLPLAIALLFVPAFSFAAETATLSGIVRDPSDAAIANANVTISEISTGASRRTVTNDNGLFSAPSLAAGTYSVTISARGFKTLQSSNILLGVAELRQLDFILELGDVTQTIAVESDTALIDSSDASVGMRMTPAFVSNLPLNGRSFQSLITLAPGVTLTGGSSDYGEFSVNGQRATSNYFTVDGVAANVGAAYYGTLGSGETQNAAGGTNGLVSVDALQEFRILTSSFSPEYGRTPGGQVVLLTRSGTNEFHGDVFEYFRNDVLNANDWFANSQGKSASPLRFNDFGGTLGGPLIKNHTFFFFSYEGQRLRQPQFGIAAVPDLTSRENAPPSLRAILNAFPIPNGPTLGSGQAQFSGGYSNPISSNSLSMRIDHAINSTAHLFGRYGYAPSDSIARGSASTSLSNLLAYSFQSETFTGGLTYVITPRMVNELRLNYSQNPAYQNYSLDTFGGAVPLPASTLLVPPLSPETAAGRLYLGFAGSLFWVGKGPGSEPRQANLVNGLSIVDGKHQLKFGLDYFRSFPIYYSQNDDIYTFSGMPGFLAGTISSFTALYVRPTRSDTTNLSLYGQDTWRVSPALTLTYGIRWDVNPPPRDRYANNGNHLPISGNYALGNILFGQPGGALWSTQYTNLAPRLGIAYSRGRKSSWVTTIRFGLGLFYDVASEGSLLLPYTSSYPNSLTTSLSNITFPVNIASAALPLVSLTNPPKATFYSYPNNFAAPRSWQWNASIEQALGSTQTLTLSYVAAIGRKLLYQQLFQSVSSVGYKVVDTENWGASNYQALQLQFNRRLARGLTAIANYTWSHSLDDSSTDIASLLPGQYQSPRQNWGSSDFDVRQSLSGAVSYNIPDSPRTAWLRGLGRGWGLDALITSRTALPVDVGSYQTLLNGSYLLRPDLISNVPLYLSDSTVAGGTRLNPAAFAIVRTGQGTLGRNALRGFGLNEADLSAHRAFRLTEELTMLFRADAFNVLNHPNFANPTSDPTSGLFGISTSMANGVLGGTRTGVSLGQNAVFQTGGPRSFQLSLKLQF